MATRDPGEFLILLKDQFDHLSSSAKGFDDGLMTEHVRMAQTLRVLMHDTNLSTSLLAHGGWKENIWYLDTSLEYRVDNAHPSATLLYRTIGEDDRFVAPLFDRFLQACRKCGSPACRTKQLTAHGYPKWTTSTRWSERIVLAGPENSWPISAKQLVLWVANKDGGAHVDSSLPAIYKAVTRDNSIGLRSKVDDNGSYQLTLSGDDGDPVESPVPATIRQLAFEILWSLHSYFDLPKPTWVPKIPKNAAVVAMPYSQAGSQLMPMNRIRLSRAGEESKAQTEEFSVQLDFKNATRVHPWPLLGPPHPSDGPTA